MKYVMPVIMFLLLLTPVPLTAGTIHVPEDYSTIQQAVDAAENGDTILVADGTWAGASIEELEVTIRSENGHGNCTVSHEGTGFYISYASSVEVDGFTITGDGIGIYADGGLSSCVVENCLITWNWEGGLVSSYAVTTVRNCQFIYNLNTLFGGGGIHAWGGFTAENCLFFGNETRYNPSAGYYGGQGGAIWCTFSSPTIINCTFTSNFATNVGGAIASSEDHAATAGKMGDRQGSPVINVENCILWDNNSGADDEVYMSWGAILQISYSTVDGGQAACTGNLDWGEGMIENDPLFVSGSLGDHFLSQIAAGQTSDSPCVDTGNPDTPLLMGTTRTDLVQDSDIIDMGWHYQEPSPEPEEPLLLAGPGPQESNPPLVRVFPPEQGAAPVAEFAAYSASSFGVNVTTGDLNGDGISWIITGPGPGTIYGPHVRGFTLDGMPLTGLNFLAYGTNKYGVNVAAGDIDGDGYDEIITGAGPGAVFGPHVRGWNYDGTGQVTAIPGVSFFAYGTPKWGVNVACGDIDDDGYDEIVTGPGPGAVYGPHVRGWNYDGTPPVTPIPGCSFFAYGTYQYGVNVSCGDVDGDGVDEIVTAPGPGPMFGAHVRGFEMDGTPLPGLSFFAWPPDEVRYGANVFAGADLDDDGWNEMVVGSGPDPDADTMVKVFTYDGSQVTEWFWLEAFPGMAQGTNVAAGRF